MGRWRVPHRPIRTAEVVKFGDLADAPRRIEGDWGPWALDSTNRELVHRDGDYPIDLMRCYDSAAVLDWIMQVAGKRWSDPKTTAGLVTAINDIIHPQSTLCSWGNPTRLDSLQLAQLIDTAAELCADADSLAPREQCPEHRGKPAGSCGLCRASRIAVAGPTAPACADCECRPAGYCSAAASRDSENESCDPYCPCRKASVSADSSGLCAGCETTTRSRT